MIYDIFLLMYSEEYFNIFTIEADVPQSVAIFKGMF